MLLTSNDLEVPLTASSTQITMFTVTFPVPAAFNGSTHLQDVEGSEMDEVDAAFRRIWAWKSLYFFRWWKLWKLLDEVQVFFRLNGSLHPMPAVVNSNVHQSNNPFNESFGSYEGYK